MGKTTSNDFFVRNWKDLIRQEKIGYMGMVHE